MVSILESISPVFLVILLGFMSRRMGFLPDIFISSANRLVYYIAIPILVFDEISRGSFSQSFDMHQIARLQNARRRHELAGIEAGTAAHDQQRRHVGEARLRGVDEGRPLAGVIAVLTFVDLFGLWLVIGRWQTPKKAATRSRKTPA